VYLDLMVSWVYSTLGELTVKRSLAGAVLVVDPLAWPTTSSAWGAMLVAVRLLFAYGNMNLSAEV
jgi:hypothetical protein